MIFYAVRLKGADYQWGKDPPEQQTAELGS